MKSSRRIEARGSVEVSRRPLSGRSVAVTREERAGTGLGGRLEELGASVLRWTAVRTAPPEERAPLLQAVEELRNFEWIVFTSPRAVKAVTGALAASGTTALPGGLRVAVVGTSTAAAAAGIGWPVHRIPKAFGAKELVDLFRASPDTAGARVLYPAASASLPTLVGGLEAAGAVVTRVIAYRTLPGLQDPESVRADLAARRVHAVTFASPSAVEGLVAGLGAGTFDRLCAEVPVAAIGPTTAASLEGHRVARLETAGDNTLDGLARAVVKLLEE